MIAASKIGATASSYDAARKCKSPVARLPLQCPSVKQLLRFWLAQRSRAVAQPLGGSQDGGTIQSSPGGRTPPPIQRASAVADRHSTQCRDASTSGECAERGSHSVSVLPRLQRRAIQSRSRTTRYTSRWQVETVHGMLKRLLDSEMRARSDWARYREMVLRALTMNIVILRRSQVFYRAPRVAVQIRRFRLKLWFTNACRCFS